MVSAESAALSACSASSKGKSLSFRELLGFRGGEQTSREWGKVKLCKGK